jgi:Na+-driven multidrug efflux pump
MNDTTLNIVLAAAAVAWLAACTLLYKAFRGAAWLAGPTVASCLSFLGVTVIASLILPGALFLAPAWLAVILLSALHLRRARAEGSARKEAGGSPAVFRDAAPAATSMEEDWHI